MKKSESQIQERNKYFAEYYLAWAEIIARIELMQFHTYINLLITMATDKKRMRLLKQKSVG